MSAYIDSDQGYDGQSEDDSDEEQPRRRRKRFTQRSRPPPMLFDSSLASGSSGHSSGEIVERSESGHALFFDPKLKAWRRHETGVRRTRKANARLTPEEITPAVKELRRTPSGTKVVYDVRRRCWRRQNERKTVNYRKLTKAQREAKKTPSGTDIYFDETRQEWRRRYYHDSDVLNPTKAQIALKRTGSGSAMVYDESRQLWKRKKKRKHVDPKLTDLSKYPNCKLVHSNGQWYLEKKRKHLEKSELSEKQIKARRTGSGTPIFFDEVHRKWQRRELLPPEGSSSEADSHKGRSTLRRRGHRHHHGFKRISYVYKKSKLTGKWSKRPFKAADKHAKRLRTVDGGFIYFDYERNRWRKASRDGPGEERKLGFFARIREYFLGESDESDGSQLSENDDDRNQNPQFHMTSYQSSQLQHSGGRREQPAGRSSRGCWGCIRRFFRAICCWLRLC